MNSQGITEHFVTSKDGTRIGYLEQGSGPGLVLLQGAFATVYNFEDFARCLATSFTVYRAERRGRGLSPKPYDESHSIDRDVEDVDAILEATGATRLYGLSSGAVIALECARTLPRVTKAVLYEPPFYPDDKPQSQEGILSLFQDIEKEDWGAALVAAGVTAQMVPEAIGWLPKVASRLLGNVLLFFDDRKTTQYKHLRELIPAVRYDMNIVGKKAGKIHMYSEVDKPILVLSGDKSQMYLRNTARQLPTILPQATHVEIEGVDHFASWNVSYPGNPEKVAESMREWCA